MYFQQPQTVLMAENANVSQIKKYSNITFMQESDQNNNSRKLQDQLSNQIFSLQASNLKNISNNFQLDSNNESSISANINRFAPLKPKVNYLYDDKPQQQNARQQGGISTTHNYNKARELNSRKNMSNGFQQVKNTRRLSSFFVNSINQPNQQ